MESKSFCSHISFLKIFLVLLFSFANWSMFGTTFISLANEKKDRFEQDIEVIKERIKTIYVNLDGLAEERATLKETLTGLDKQITNLQAIITRTKKEIQRLQQEIKALEKKIAAQKKILEHILIVLWQNIGASPFELMISSDNFSDYLDNQEYLDRLKDEISQSVKRIQILNEKLQEESRYQEKLLDDQKAQEVALKATHTQQEHLIEVTQNEERLFREQVTQLEKEQAQLEKELQTYLESLLRSKTSLGSVSAAEIIGKNGNTGWSTGPHLHLAIYVSSNPSIKHNPLIFINQQNLTWPMGGGGGWVSQGYHRAHQALDIAAKEGTPVLAIADGEIIHRGCFKYSNPKYTHFGVIINHGEFVSVYVHLQAPNNSEYKECSINRMPPNDGKKSIDYSTMK